jgi:hypothetical protein
MQGQLNSERERFRLIPGHPALEASEVVCLRIVGAPNVGGQGGPMERSWEHATDSR